MAMKPTNAYKRLLFVVVFLALQPFVVVFTQPSSGL